MFSLFFLDLRRQRLTTLRLSLSVRIPRRRRAMTLGHQSFLNGTLELTQFVKSKGHSRNGEHLFGWGGALHGLLDFLYVSVYFILFYFFKDRIKEKVVFCGTGQYFMWKFLIYY